MRLRPFFPDAPLLAKWHQAFTQLPHSYPEVGQTAGDFPIGYDHDFNEVYLGHGHDCFEQAKTAMQRWQMFPRSWTRIYPADTPIEEGQVVMVLFQLFGCWWANACRIIYTVNEAHRFGFAYGTIKGHVEKGEEYFGIRMEADGSVWYEIRAFSRPAIWLTRLTYPLARRFQRRFVRDSKAQMKLLATATSPVSPET